MWGRDDLCMKLHIRRTDKILDVGYTYSADCLEIVNCTRPDVAIRADN